MNADELPPPAPVIDAAAGAGVPDARPWRLRRPVAAGFVLYGGLAVFVAVVGWFWLREREQGRQDGLVTRIHAIEQSGLHRMDPDRAIRILEDEVLSQRPSADVRRQALLELAATYDAAGRYDDANRTYEVLRSEWPAGLALGSLCVPWANMLVTAGKAARARELLAGPGATRGYGTEAEVEAVRARLRAALEAPPAPTPAGPGAPAK